MSTPRSRRAHLPDWRDDTGASLVMALVVVTTVAVVTGALLTHGWTNLRTTVSLRGVAGTAYAADAAATVAIDHLRQGSDAPGWTPPTFPGLWDDWVFTHNADGTGCFGAVGDQPDDVLELPGLQPAAGDQSAPTSARVECTVVPGTGIFSGAGIDDPDPTDAFARALTTVGTSGTRQGITLKPLGTANQAPMPMRGGVASRSYVDVDSGALVTDGHVRAQGACTGRIVSTPAAECGAPGSVPEPAAPPSPLASVPAHRDPQAAVACRFQPGFYNDAARLSAAVNACSPARFEPGDYYFDFVDERHGGQNEWRITTTLIGGSYLGSATPGGCRSPIDHETTPGVRFVFGGTSRIALGDTARVELCGPSASGGPAIALYQQQTGATPATQSLGPLAAGTVSVKTAGKFVTPVARPAAATPVAALAAADASDLTWTIASNGTNEAGLDLRDFPGLAAVPAGADVTSATLRVKYTKASARPLTATVEGQLPATLPVSAPDATGWGTVELADQLRTQLESGALGGSRPTVQLRLEGADKNDVLTLDAVSLTVTYVPPALRETSEGTFVSAPGGNFKGTFVVQGATYAPRGYVDLVPGSDDEALVAFRWGLVASGVAFKAQPPQVFGYPLVSIPDAGRGLGSRVTVLDLRVHVCVEAATCASGGTHALTARVAVTDPPYASGAPTPGRRRIDVLSWSEQR